MARQKSALVALKNLEKSYEEQRRALLRKAEEEMAATVHKMVGELVGIAKDFPKLVSSAVAAIVHAPSSPPTGKSALVAVAKAVGAPAEEQATGRFRAMGVKAHRAKLGLSADDYGKLVGVSGSAIYLWETGKSKPQQAQKAKWLAIRSLGKKEALLQLGTAAPKASSAGPAAKSAAQKRRKRGTFKQTAEEMILAILKGKKALTSELAAAWKKAGRGGTVHNVLGRMVKAKTLIRKPLGGKQGSEYGVA